MFDTEEPSMPGHYAPTQTALLLLDFHTSFVEDMLGQPGRAVAETAAQLRAWTHSRGIRIIHCLIDIDAEPSITTKGSTRLAGIVQGMREKADREHVALSEHSEGDIFFTRKPGHVSALKSPGLEDYLHENGVKSLLLAGLSTSGCVCYTAIAATDGDFVTTVISDACADPAEDLHRIVIEQILRRSYSCTAQEFREGYGKIHEPETSGME